MPTSWPRVSLGDHVDLLTGFLFKSADFTDDPQDLRLVKGVNVGQGNLRWEHTDYWQRAERSEFSRYELAVGDVVLAMDRPWVGAGLKQAAVTGRDAPALLLQRVARLRGIRGLSTGYLRYLISSQAFSDYIKPIVTGVNVPHISPDQIRGFTFPLPPESVQHRVAAVLAAYDELIENNLRRIEILEEMAQAVYREWFVNFRYPGHENVPLVDSPLGPIPEGWEVATVDEAFDILGGATPSTKQPRYWEGGSINWYTPSDLTSHGHMFISQSRRRITPDGLARSSATLFPAGSVMMTSRATLGVVAINLEPACTNQGFITCLPNDRVSAAHIYFWIKSNLPLIESLATGATFKEIAKRAFRQMQFLVASDGVEEGFAEAVAPSMSLVANLINQNANLRTTRDLLLPKLVSGEIGVSDLNIDTEWLAS